MDLRSNQRMAILPHQTCEDIPDCEECRPVLLDLHAQHSMPLQTSDRLSDIQKIPAWDHHEGPAGIRMSAMLASTRMPRYHSVVLGGNVYTPCEKGGAAEGNKNL